MDELRNIKIYKCIIIIYFVMMQKIIKINIREPTIRKQTELSKLYNEYLACSREIFGVWKFNNGISRYQIQSMIYNDFRKKYHLQSAFIQASLFQVFLRRKVCEEIRSIPIRFDKRMFSIKTDKGLFVISVAGYTKSKRVHLPVVQDGAYQRLTNYLIKGWQISSILIFKDFRVQILIKKEFEKPTESKNIIGIDTNGSNIAVSVYNSKKNKFLRHFYFGKDMFIKRKIIERRKSKLRGFADLGSQKAFKSLRRLKRYEYNFIKDNCWKIAHKVISLSKTFGNASIVVEDLYKLRTGRKLGNSKGKKVNKIINKIPYAKLFHSISCLCEENIISFNKINPYHTSKLCSRCGALNEFGKVYKTYVCKSCGLIIDRDNNASRNICKLFGERSIITNVSQTSPNGVAVNQPLFSNATCVL
jgi:putative transposase